MTRQSRSLLLLTVTIWILAVIMAVVVYNLYTCHAPVLLPGDNGLWWGEITHRVNYWVGLHRICLPGLLPFQAMNTPLPFP